VFAPLALGLAGLFCVFNAPPFSHSWEKGESLKTQKKPRQPKGQRGEKPLFFISVVV